MNRSRQGLAHAGIATALRPHAAIAGIVAVEALAVFLVACLVPREHVLPVLSIGFLTAAGVLALVAWCIRSDSNKTSVWDLAGACAFIGFGAGILSTPEDILAALAVTAAG